MMSEEAPVYTWVRLSSAECLHNLLVRVEPRGDGAEGIDRRLGDLIKQYLSTVLYEVCRQDHSMSFNGISRLTPVGRELIESPGGEFLDVWVAPANVPGSTLQWGTAADQPAFWSAFAQQASDELKQRVTPAAESMQVFLLAENNGASAAGPATASSAS